MKTERQDDSMRTLEFVVTGQTLEQNPIVIFLGWFQALMDTYTLSFISQKTGLGAQKL